MRLHMVLLDHALRVSGLAGTLELQWRGPRGMCSYALQLRVRLAGGQWALAGCVAGHEVSTRQGSVAWVVGEICASAGWQYWVWGPVGLVYRCNVVWLAGYRHPRFRGEPWLQAAL